jgi:hypothetical protein
MGGTGMGGPCAGGTGMGGTCMGGNSIDDEMFRTGPCEPADCAINGLPIEFENHGFAETFGCCLDEDDVTVGCGIMIEGGPCVPQPRQDSRCPWFTQGLNDERQSCCTESGLCGVDAWSLGMGCVDYATVRSGPLSEFFTVPDPVRCDGSEIPGSEDAGSD